MIGTYLEISWSEDGKNYTTYNTYDNGLCSTSYGGDNKHKANAMLVSLEANKVYRFKVLDTYKSIKYNKNELAHACMIFGKDVEKLPNHSSDYTILTQTEKYCMINAEGFIVEADDPSDNSHRYSSSMIKLWLKYTNSSMKYNYYSTKTLRLEEGKL